MPFCHYILSERCQLMNIYHKPTICTPYRPTHHTNSAIKYLTFQCIMNIGGNISKIVIKGEKGKQFIIDLEDPIQRRYELVRKLKLSAESKEDICEHYNYSRVMGHIYETAWDKNRWDGIKDKKKGPKKKSKRTEDLEKRILEIRFKDPKKDMYDITDILIEEGYDVSSRTVARALSEHGVTLKKTKKKA